MSRLVRVVAYIKRFIHNAKTQSKKKTSRWLDNVEVFDAEKTIVKLIQNDVFKEEVTIFQNNLPLNQKSKLISLDPYMDNEGILRIGGRLRNCNLETSSNKMIIPTHHHVTNLLIYHIHESQVHCGKEYLLAILRQRFWVTKPRSVIRKIIHKCMVCKKRKRNPIPQRMADLPSAARAIDSPPFSSVLFM